MGKVREGEGGGKGDDGGREGREGGRGMEMGREGEAHLFTLATVTSPAVLTSMRHCGKI